MWRSANDAAPSGGAGGDADRQPRRPVTARRRDAARVDADLLRGHPPLRAAAAHAGVAASVWRCATSTPRPNAVARCSPRSTPEATSPWSPTPAHPGITDPGERLVRVVLDAGYEVSACPGRQRFVMALVVSGLPTRPGSSSRGSCPDRAGRGGTGSPIGGRATHDRACTRRRIGRTARSPISPRRAAATTGRSPSARELTKLYETVWRAHSTSVTRPRRAARRVRHRVGRRARRGERQTTTRSAPPCAPSSPRAHHARRRRHRGGQLEVPKRACTTSRVTESTPSAAASMTLPGGSPTPEPRRRTRIDAAVSEYSQHGRRRSERGVLRSRPHADQRLERVRARRRRRRAGLVPHRASSARTPSARSRSSSPGPATTPRRCARSHPRRGQGHPPGRSRRAQRRDRAQAARQGPARSTGVWSTGIDTPGATRTSCRRRPSSWSNRWPRRSA